jgi:DNA-binding HxlR family transcriptional regulator
MVLLDLLGRRMTLRVLWELSIAGTPLTFRALQAAVDTNPSVLNARLRELREKGLVVRGETGYALTDSGRSLVAVLMPLHTWADSWPKALAGTELLTGDAEVNTSVGPKVRFPTS